MNMLPFGFRFTALLLAITVRGTGQLQSRDPETLVDLLTSGASRPNSIYAEMGITSCDSGMRREDNDIAAALRSLGRRSIPVLEKKIQQFEFSRAELSGVANVGLLLRVYGEIGQSDSKALLLRLSRNVEFKSFLPGIDKAIAIATGLDGYVSSSRRAAQKHFCDGWRGPKDVLEEFMAGWLQADEPFMLGCIRDPSASTRSRISNRIGDRRLRLSSALADSGPKSIGFLFEDSEKVATGRQDGDSQSTRDSYGLASRSATRKVINVKLLVDGTVCRSVAMGFATESISGTTRDYRMEDDGIDALMTTLSTCSR